MDILRGAAILAVIFFHSVTIPAAYGFEANAIWRYVNETLILFRMPMLVFLSGMLLSRSLEKPSLSYFNGKVSGILWPFLIWSTTYALVTDVDFGNLGEIQNIYTGGSPLWYLLFIFTYYLAAKPLNRLSPLVIAAVTFGLAVLSPDGAKYSERVFYLMSLFFLGDYAARHADRIGTIIASRYIWLLLPVLLGSALATVAYDLDFGPNWVVFSLIGILLFAAISQRIEPFAISRVLVWVGQHSIVFYVSHAIVIHFTAQLMVRAGVSSYAVTALASVLLSLFAGWALSVGNDRWVPVRWLFTLPALAGRKGATRPA